MYQPNGANILKTFLLGAMIIITSFGTEVINVKPNQGDILDRTILTQEDLPSDWTIHPSLVDISLYSAQGDPCSLGDLLLRHRSDWRGIGFTNGVNEIVQLSLQFYSASANDVLISFLNSVSICSSLVVSVPISPLDIRNIRTVDRAIESFEVDMERTDIIPCSSGDFSESVSKLILIAFQHDEFVVLLIQNVAHISASSCFPVEIGVEDLDIPAMSEIANRLSVLLASLN